MSVLAARRIGPARQARKKPTLAECVVERLLVVAGGIPPGHDAGDYDTALEAVLRDPFMREGISREATEALGYIEGVADSMDVLVSELLDGLGISLSDGEG